MSDSGGIFGLSGKLLLNRNIRVIAVTGLISGIYVGMLNGILQLFPLSLGFGVAALGILQAAGNRFSGVAASVAQPIAGHYSDIFGRKVVIVVGSIATIASMVCFIGAAFNGNWILLFVAFLSFGVSALGSPASQAMVAESVEMDVKKMNVAYSVVFFFSSIPGAITPYIAGETVDVYGYAVIFAAAAILEAGDLYLYVRELTETMHVVRPAEVVVRARFSLRESFRIPKGSMRYFSALAMDAFAFGITTSIIYAMLFDKFGFDPAQIGILVAVFSLAITLSQYPATRLLLLLGGRKTIAFSEALGTMLMIGWGLANTFPDFVLLSIVFGVSVTTWVPGVQSILMANSPAKERGGIGGKVAAVRGLVAFPAPILGGFLYQSFGYEAPIVASVIGTVMAVVMILRFVPDAEIKIEGLQGAGANSI
jgi:MFS family permease